MSESSRLPSAHADGAAATGDDATVVDVAMPADHDAKTTLYEPMRSSGLRPRLGEARSDAILSAAETQLLVAPSEQDARSETTEVSACAAAHPRIGIVTTLRWRTWCLSIATVLAAAFVVMMPAPATTPHARSPQAAPAAARTAPHATETDPTAAECDTDAPTDREGTLDAPAVEDEDGEVDPAAAVAGAADLLIARRYREALPLYEDLSSAHPDVAEYRLVVRILHAQIGEP